MLQTTLGRSGLKTSSIAFGTSSIGGLYRALSDFEANEVLQRAWDQGIRYFDTAPLYGFGRAEQRLGQFLSQQDDNFVVSTKVGRVLNPVAAHEVLDFGFVDPLPYAPSYDYSYDGIMRSFEASSARMPGIAIDILYVHDIGTMTHGVEANQGHCRDLFDSGFKALQELKRSQDIKAFGLGVNEVDICLQVIAQVDIDAILLAGRYTLLDRSAEQELLAQCEQRNIGLVIGGVFNSGILATGAIAGARFEYGEAPAQVMAKVDKLQQACAASGVALADAALQFPLLNAQVSALLLGTGRASAIDRSMASLAQQIPAALWPTCDCIARE